MINIQSHIEKLEGLKKYISLSIDDRLPTMIDYGISIEIAYNPAMPPDTIIQIFQGTGRLYYRGGYQHSQSIPPFISLPIHPVRPMTFEE